MTRWVLSIEAADDLDQLVDFPIENFPQEAVQTVDLVTGALCILEQHPKIGRPVEQDLRELVISRGKSGCLALYQYDEAADLVVVLAVRHQREQGYHRYRDPRSRNLLRLTKSVREYPELQRVGRALQCAGQYIQCFFYLSQLQSLDQTCSGRESIRLFKVRLMS